MLVGVSQLGAATRRNDIVHVNCGVTTGTGLVVPAAKLGIKPHQPLPTANRIDNRGTMSEGA